MSVVACVFAHIGDRSITILAVLLILNISKTTVQNSTDFTQNRYFSDSWWHLNSSKIHFFKLTDLKKNNLKIQIIDLSLVSNFAYSCIDMTVYSLCNNVWCVYLCIGTGIQIPASQQACSARGQYAFALTLYALMECVFGSELSKCFEKMWICNCLFYKSMKNTALKSCSTVVILIDFLDLAFVF